MEKQWNLKISNQMMSPSQVTEAEALALFALFSLASYGFELEFSRFSSSLLTTSCIDCEDDFPLCSRQPLLHR